LTLQRKNIFEISISLNILLDCDHAHRLLITFLINFITMATIQVKLMQPVTLLDTDFICSATGDAWQTDLFQ
jgi:hypothetical protein